MADQVLGVAVEAVVTQAFSLARERITSAWGVEEDLRSLAQQLEMIQAILSDADTKSTTSALVQLWLKKLEDAATDAYFLLDEFGYHVLRKKFEKRSLDKVRRFFSSSNPIAFRFEMASKIKRANLNFDAIRKESEKIGLVRNEIINSSKDIRNDRITDPFVVDSEVVGRNDDVKEIFSKLTSFEDDDLSVIGIVGMAGQGKTKLAQLVYKKEEVTRCFEQKIWVCVSDDFTVEKILNDMLQSLTGTVSVLTIRQAMVNKLKKELKEKRFLLVLDDVWNEDDEKWFCMERCLLEIGGSKGSKIIVTTRNERAVMITRKFHIHQLGALSEEDSWKLFEKIAFANGEAIKDPDLVAIGEKIVRRCSGLPLAIRALAGLMYSKRNASEWSNIAESNIWDSLNPQTKVMSVVKLSYDHLPSLSMRQCFAYCAIFPKDTIIRREVLIQQWMAHGLLNPSQGSKLEMEEVGNNYFEILLQRSLLQDVEFDKLGNIYCCKMHDVVHDFVSQASKDRCLIIEDGGQSEDIVAVHLSIFSNRRGKSSVDATLIIPSTLRTFLLYDGSFHLDGLVECKYLCVLVLHDWMIKSLPSSIAKMKHLRCLDTYYSSIESLPNSITKLYNLQTLRLYKFQKLPRDFGNLVKLRYFTVLLEKKALLPGISRLTSLRMLPYFIVSRDKRCQIKELQYLHNLEGELKIYGLENVSNREEAMKADLLGKKSIVNLQLHWGDDIKEDTNCEDVIEGLKPHKKLNGLKIFSFAGRSFPSWFQFLDHLVSIELHELSHCEQLPLLAQLPCLKRVYIDGMESLKCIGNEFYGQKIYQSSSHVVSFQSLQGLHLRNMSNLEQWLDPSYEFFDEVFPVLEKLEIHSAPKLTHLPNFLTKISSLKKLRLGNLCTLSHLPDGLGEFLSLEEMSIWDCHGLAFALNAQSFKSLKRLTIVRCNNLKILDNMLDLCQKLVSVDIAQCDSIRFEDLCYPTNLQHLELGLPKDVDYEEFSWPSRKCNYFLVLDRLYLKGNSKTKSLPKQIQHLPNLRILHVSRFGGMEVLPEWLCNIPTLRELVFLHCESLAYLPSRATLQRMTASCDLVFSCCPLLKNSPERDKTANLPKISFP